MKTIKIILALHKARRSSEINYEYCNYKYNSFFRVLWFKLFGIVTKYPKKYEIKHVNKNGTIPATIFNRPGCAWMLSVDDLLEAPISYLISAYFFSGFAFKIQYFDVHKTVSFIETYERNLLKGSEL